MSKKFEYFITKNLEVKHLNEFSKKGWNLVCVIKECWHNERKGCDEYDYKFYLKKEIQ